MIWFILLLPVVFCIEKTVLLNGGGCGVATKVPGGIVVSHDPIDLNLPLSNNIVCLFSVQGYRPRHTIRFVFEHFSIFPNDCSQGFIKMYDAKTNDTTKQLNPTICPGDDATALEFISTSNWITLQIQVNVGADPPKVNFSANYASFTQKPCKFADEEMECATEDRCLYNELQCDGVDSCGDGTDEDTSPPANCNVTATEPSLVTGPTASATSQGTTNSITTQPSSSENPVFKDFTPLILILVIASICLAVYIFYWMMSFAWCSNLVLSCLKNCLMYCARKKRNYKQKQKENKQVGSLSKISPEVAN